MAEEEEPKTRRRRPRRWVPACPAAVVLLVTTTWLTVGGDTPGPGAGRRDVPSFHREARFLITTGVPQNGERTNGNPPWLQVRALTGSHRDRPVHAVPPPSPSAGTVREVIEGPGGTFVAVAARARPCASRVYRFRLTGDGHATRIEPVSGGTVAALAGGVAISPDGRRVAFTAVPCAGWQPGTARGVLPVERPSKATLTVLDTVSGHRRTWTASENSIIGEIVWAGDGRTLGYALGEVVRRAPAYRGGLPAPAPDVRGTTVNALDVRTAGTRLPAGRVLYRHQDGAGILLSATMGPDGRTGFGMMRKAEPASTVMFSFAEGRPIRVTRTIPHRPGMGIGVARGESRYACPGHLDAFGRVVEGTLSSGRETCGSAYAH
ncbi:hypothetical protein ACFY4C_06390 [Actinomadura viridis]|uniref:hypothetical protein n=1 Tax=Actinomadura viridis TaxID=58110 RepID=UPI0036B54BC0